MGETKSFLEVLPNLKLGEALSDFICEMQDGLDLQPDSLYLPLWRAWHPVLSNQEGLSTHRQGPGVAGFPQAWQLKNQASGERAETGKHLPPAGGTTWSSSFMLVRFQIFLIMARSSSLACSRFPEGREADTRLK